MEETRALGRSGLTSGPIAFGGAQIGNFAVAISDDEALETVEAAWNGGIRYFDVAPHYGLGLAEERLGIALSSRPRDEFVISTKVGRSLVPNPDGPLPDDEGFKVVSPLMRRYDFSRDGVLRSIEASLRRLQLDRIDIVYVHDPDGFYSQAMNEAFPALEELRSQGVIASYGAGMNQAGMLADFVRYTDADIMMGAGVLTLLDRSALEHLAPEAERRGASIVAAAPFNSGLLATAHPSVEATFNYAKAPADLIDRAERIAELCTSHGVSLPAAALQYPLRSRAVSAVCVGMRSASQVQSNLELMATNIPEALWADLDESGLLHADAAR
jgi:D-threo-aldose 1-dehydrogenase